MKEYTVKVYKDQIVWYKDGKRHREDGPAIESSNGDKFWYKDGNRHREDGPATEWVTGHKEWHKEGKLHREDGPAIEYTTGEKVWALHDERLTEQEHYDIVNNTNHTNHNDKIVEIDGVKYTLKIVE